ncbi:hypothetical protein [Desulfovibrio porci]
MKRSAKSNRSAKRQEAPKNGLALYNMLYFLIFLEAPEREAPKIV